MEAVSDDLESRTEESVTPLIDVKPQVDTTVFGDIINYFSLVQVFKDNISVYEFTQPLKATKTYIEIVSSPDLTALISKLGVVYSYYSNLSKEAVSMDVRERRLADFASERLKIVEQAVVPYIECIREIVNKN